MSSPYISTLQAAEALGVSVSTVKRWVDEGVLPAQRSPGGHRKLLRSEVMALSREGVLPRADQGKLILGTRDGGALDTDSVCTALVEVLLRGDAAAVRSLVRGAYDSGLPVQRLADLVIAPAMRRVGHDWQTGRIDVWHEHRGTQLCAAAVHQLHAELEMRTERRRPVALGGALQGDPYQLASSLAQLVLLDAGWEAVNLGPNTPFESLGKALRELRPKLIWLSVSHVENAKEFLREYQSFERFASHRGVAIAVGGQGLIESVRSKMLYTTHGDCLSQLAAFARQLHPRPRRPRRGRPPNV